MRRRVTVGLREAPPRSGLPPQGRLAAPARLALSRLGLFDPYELAERESTNDRR